MTFDVYILLCADGSYYVGQTDDLEQRLAEHKAGNGSRHTAARLPVEPVYTESLPKNRPLPFGSTRFFPFNERHQISTEPPALIAHRMVSPMGTVR